MSAFDRLLNRLVTFLKIVGAVALTGMMLLTCADVILRSFGSPILGSVEIVGFMATMVLACALPYTQRERGHIGVDLLVRGFSPRFQSLVQGITSFLALALFIIVAWQTAEYANTMRESGEVSMTLEFPNWIFVFWVSFSFMVLAFVLFFDMIQAFRKVARP